MRNGRCLNCENKLRGRFCHHCGQKADTHRINLPSFVKHDLVHGIWHVDKGIFYTLRTLLFRPGYAASAFLQGKRVRHYNIFALFIIVVTLKVLLETWYQGSNPVLLSIEPEGHQSARVINESIDQYYKFFYLLAIPLLAGCNKFLFRRLNYNFAEHMVLACFLLTGGLFYTLLVLLVCALGGWPYNENFGILIFSAYTLVGMYQVSVSLYKWYQWTFRGLLTVFCFLVFLFLIFLIVVAAVNGGGFTGKIKF